MVPWQCFPTALSTCSDSLIANSNLLTSPALLAIKGVRQFRRMEKRFADAI